MSWGLFGLFERERGPALELFGECFYPFDSLVLGLVPRARQPDFLVGFVPCRIPISGVRAN